MSDVIAIAKSLPQLWEELEGEDRQQRVAEAVEALSELCALPGLPDLRLGQDRRQETKEQEDNEQEDNEQENNEQENNEQEDHEQEDSEDGLSSAGDAATEPPGHHGNMVAAKYAERLQALADAIITWEIERTLDQLAASADGFPAEEIERIRTHRDLFIPRMLELYEGQLGELDVRELDEHDGLVELTMLLLEFEVEQSFPLILQALTLAEDDTEAIFGQCAYPLLGHTLALAVTHDEAYLSEVERIAEDPEYGPHRRWSAASAYRYLLRDGRLTRPQVIGALERHLRAAIAEGDEILVSSLVHELYEYGAYEAEEAIQEAFSKGLVDDMLIDQERAKDGLEKGEAKWRDLLPDIEPTQITDAAEMLHKFFLYYPDGGSPDADLEDPWSDSWEDEYGVGEPSTAMLRLPLGSVGENDWFDESDELDSTSPAAPIETLRRERARPGRNEPCPCGSGKKYKKCCLRK